MGRIFSLICTMRGQIFVARLFIWMSYFRTGNVVIRAERHKHAPKFSYPFMKRQQRVLPPSIRLGYGSGISCNLRFVFRQRFPRTSESKGQGKRAGNPGCISQHKKGFDFAGTLRLMCNTYDLGPVSTFGGFFVIMLLPQTFTTIWIAMKIKVAKNSDLFQMDNHVPYLILARPSLFSVTLHVMIRVMYIYVVALPEKNFYARSPVSAVQALGRFRRIAHIKCRGRPITVMACKFTLR
jgi:hypothetical protein